MVWGIDAVVGRDHEDHDVGDLGAARAHGGEGLVAGRVDEGNGLALPRHLVGPDVLGDPTGLAGYDVGLADLVEQEGLAVVDVTHHGDDGGTGLGGDLVVLVVLVEELREQRRLLLFTGIDEVHDGPDLGGVQLDHVVAQALHGRDDLALEEQEAHDVRGAAVELGSDVARGRAALDDDFTVGYGQRTRLPRGHLGRLELFDVSTSTARGLAL